MSSGPDLFVICKSCGSEVSPYITECPYCGTRLRKRATLDLPKRKASGARRAAPRAPRLGRLRPGEIPGIRADRSPVATIGVVVLSAIVTLVAATGLVSLFDLQVLGTPEQEPWRLVTATFAFGNTWYQFGCLVAIAIFGTALERQHGPVPVVLVVLLAGAAGLAAAAWLANDPGPLNGGNAAALGLLAAWAVPHLLARRRGQDTEGDLLGAFVLFALLVLFPVAAVEASLVAGLVGALVGALAGLARAPRAAL
jgi:membrane associated rhomboid family serine protease